MGFSAMVRRTGRVAAFAAMVVLLAQAACMIGLPSVATAQIESPGGSDCHESAPSMPHSPNSEHFCCNGNHSPEALLSAPETPLPLGLAAHFSIRTFVLSSFVHSSADISASFSGPPGLLALRI
jgi:hypothetical protein